MNKKIFFENILKINSKNFKLYILKDEKWVLSKKELPNSVKEIINKYIENNRLKDIIDETNPNFLKGSLSENNVPSGKRIKILPNGKKLARGGFSIFAKNLRFNINENNINDKNKLWDVVYENSSGSKTYLYCEDKIQYEHKKKTKIVNKFMKLYPIIFEKLENDLKNKNDKIYICLKIMLETYIRIGNLEYYQILKHKGLTTLKKKDITINKKNNFVSFSFIGKDGVPQFIQKKFDKNIINKLLKILNSIKDEDFVFLNEKKKLLNSNDFSKILFQYVSCHFYPHIIRSFHADSICKDFLKKHRKKTTKNEVEKKFTEIAKDLGHKKFNKKNNLWEVDYKVTINNYIRPEYSKRMIDLYKN